VWQVKEWGMTRRTVGAIALALIAAFGWAAPAAAHTALVSSSPAAGATVEAPASVSLTFSEALLTIGAGIVVLDAQGVDHASGGVYFPEPSTVQVDVAPLQPGAYTAQWRVVADDGHPIEGTLPFTVVAAPSPTPSPTPSATPDPSGSVAPTPSASAINVPTEGAPVDPPALDEDSRRGLYVMIAVMIGAIFVIGAAIYFSIPKDSLTGSRRRARR
jgi:methionine-rich copper-binding protein CopC